MKRNNKIAILNLLITKKKITRNELAEILGISRMAVSKLVKSLIERKYIIETDTVDTPKTGKKPKYLYINLDKFQNIMAIYFGLSSVTISIADIYGKILTTESISIGSKTDVLNTTLKKVSEILKKYKIMLISIGMNGIVDSFRGIAEISTYYHWKNLNLKEIFEKNFNITTIIENGVNLIALSQSKIYENQKDFVILNIENGVGSTISKYDPVSNKRSFELKEIGHIPFDYSESSLLCVCGNKGCLETVMANWRIEEKVCTKTGEHFSYDKIIEEANKNKSFFRDEILTLLRPLSYIILWINNLITPEKIIITGKITFIDDFFWKELKRILKNNSLDKTKEIIIERSDYNDNLIIKGALQYGIENITNSLFFESMFKGESNE
ncbi:ROK family protein [Fusobacterium varium]|uniref:ROK family protein n=1 Tax=Fusobacterium varium TaxID=856 RepID=UPI0035654ED1